MRPERVRVNMRYRGPKESMKASRLQAEATVNMNRLTEKLEAITSRLEAHRRDIYNGKMPSPVEQALDVRTESLGKRITNIERGASHG